MTSFRIPAPALLAATQWVERVIPARPVTPVLAGIVVEAGADGTILQAFDYDQATRVVADAIVSEPGRILLSGKLLSAVAKAAGKADVDVVCDGASATVSAGRSSWRLPLLPVEDYPQLPDLGAAVGSIDGDRFADAAALVTAAAGRDDTLPMLTGIKVEAVDDGLVWAGTDRFRLATCTTGWQPDLDDTGLDVLVPAALVKNIAAAARGQQVTLHVSDGMLGASMGRHTITGRLLDAQFPRWRQLLTHDDDRFVDVDAALLSAAIDQASALGGMQLRLAVGVDVIEVTETGSQNDGQATRAECPVVELAAEPMVFGANPAYLRDALAGFTGTVRLFLGATAKRPVLFEPVEDNPLRAQHLVMPVTLQDGRAAA